MIEFLSKTSFCILFIFFYNFLFCMDNSDKIKEILELDQKICCKRELLRSVNIKLLEKERKELTLLNNDMNAEIDRLTKDRDELMRQISIGAKL